MPSVHGHQAPSVAERARVIDELHAIWTDPAETPQRRRKAKQAWKQLTDAQPRSYGDPANFIHPDPADESKPRRRRRKGA